MVDRLRCSHRAGTDLPSAQPQRKDVVRLDTGPEKQYAGIAQTQHRQTAWRRHNR